MAQTILELGKTVADKTSAPAVIDVEPVIISYPFLSTAIVKGEVVRVDGGAIKLDIWIV